MGYRKPLDYGTVRHQIMVAAYELRNHRVDGFNQWCIKQDLYRIKYLLDHIIATAPQFPDDAEFVKGLEQEKLITTLQM